MKPEDMEFVRSQMNHNRPDIQRLLSLLIESEAMREKAWFFTTSRNYAYLTKEEQQHYDWSDAEWIVAKKKEWGI